MSAGNDIHKFKSISEFLDVTALDGGAGNDTLRFVGADGSLDTATGGNILDVDFDGITNFESITVGNGNWDLDLGARTRAAFTNGVAQIAATETTDQLWVQIRAGGPTLHATGSAGNDRLYGGDGNDTINGGTGGNDILRGYAGNDTIVFRGNTLTASDTVDGGAGFDTLRFLDGATVNDAAFLKTTGFEQVTLGSGNYSFTLGANAAKAFEGGQAKIYASDATGGLNVTVAASGPAITVVGSAGADTITGGDGADMINGGGGDDMLNGGAGNDTFTFYGNTLTSGDTVTGGSGYDVLRLLDGATLGDDAFTNVSGIEGVSLGAGAYSLTFGAEAKTAFDGGNVRVNAAQATSTEVDASALGRSGFRFAFTGGAGEDSVILGGNIATVTGGGGADEYILTKNSFYKAVVTDFEDGVDQLVMNRSDLSRAVGTPEEWDALLASVTSDTADGLLVNGNALGLGGTITLAGVTKAEFDQSDFILV